MYSWIKDIICRSRNKYSSIIFGNGFNYAVLQELQSAVDEKYRYLFNMKEFLVKLKQYEQEEWSNEQHDQYIELAEDIIKKSHRKKLVELCENIEKYHYGIDAIDMIINLEPYMFIFAYKYAEQIFSNKSDILFLTWMFILGESEQGVTIKLKERLKPEYYQILFSKIDSNMKKKKKKLDNMMDNIFFYYNLFDAVQRNFISENNLLIERRERYYKKFAKGCLKKDAIIMTTNYGIEIKDAYKNVEYLHGHFAEVEDKKLEIRDKEGNYCFLFGASACHKHKEIEAGIYGNSFFHDPSRTYGDLLIYGISFAKIKELSDFAVSGNAYDFHIDMHIMKRIDELFELNKIDSLTIVAYSRIDRNNYASFFNSFKGNKYTNIYELYQKGQIRIVSGENFKV